MPKKLCPLIKDECMEHGCEFYTHLAGVDPQSGKTIDKFDCAVKWMPMLMVEVAGKLRQNSAAIEDFRNKAVGALQSVGNVMVKRLEQIDT